MKRIALSALLLSSSLLHAENEDGLTAVYNGKDLTGFKTEGNWISEAEGILAINPREGEKGWQRYGSYLWLEKQYADFTFSVDFKYPKGGNSGVFFRVKDTKSPVSTGIEAQILDSFGKKNLGQHDMGGIISTIGPSKNMSKPAGEWNTMVVTCKGAQLQVELNGEQIVEIDLSESAVKDRPLKGYIGLQDHGAVMWFRNIKIKEL
ncbi:MAG: DUF1080 domain-containing protein [Planctomycetota bacterium]|nr:DUF1080 domain-containing protein [Planctomycetota bacterium]